MGEKSKISWTATVAPDGTVTEGSTWNPLLGCSRVSSGCANCLAPETRILYADMVWRPIGEAEPGDRLLGIQETATGHNRSFRDSVVLAKWESHRTATRLRTDRADVWTTDEHRWLLRGHGDGWVTTSGLRLGIPLRQVGVNESPPETEDYRAGYLSGMTAGDGTWRYVPGQRNTSRGNGEPACYWRIALQERDVAVLGRIVAYLGHLGIDARTRPFDGGPRSKSPMLKVESRSVPVLAVLDPLLHAERTTPEYERGWLAGFFDAEGNGGNCIRVTQRAIGPLERFRTYAAHFGFAFVIELNRDSTLKSTARLVGTLHDRMRFFATLQPALVRKVTLGGTASRSTADPVVAVERSAPRDVVDIQTSTGTFYAEGLATHNCYAIGVEWRMARNPNPAIRAASAGLVERRENGQLDWTGTINLIPARLEQPLRWKRPRRIFVNSLSDLFHEDVPADYIVEVFAVMAAARQHTFQVLTKRPERMRDTVNDRTFADRVDTALGRRAERTGWRFREMDEWPLPNVWLGTSIEENRWTVRADALRQATAAVRFVSAEPLLEALPSLQLVCPWCEGAGRRIYQPVSGLGVGRPETTPCPACNGTGGRIDWVIAGGESGPAMGFRKMVEPCDACAMRDADLAVAEGSHRPARPWPDCERCGGTGWAPRQWAVLALRDLRDRCAAAGVAFHFKQFGGPSSGSGGHRLDGREYREFPGDRGTGAMA